jgi:hypothetical protein
MNGDRGDELTLEQERQRNASLWEELRITKEEVRTYKKRWHDARYHLRVANKALEVRARLTELQAHQINNLARYNTELNTKLQAK